MVWRIQDTSTKLGEATLSSVDIDLGQEAPPHIFRRTRQAEVDAPLKAPHVHHLTPRIFTWCFQTLSYHMGLGDVAGFYRRTLTSLEQRQRRCQGTANDVRCLWRRSGPGP